jgi:hypothetical protein
MEKISATPTADWRNVKTREIHALVRDRQVEAREAATGSKEAKDDSG